MKMKNNIIASIIGIASFTTAFAGNPDRRGEAGANELNMNPYARTAGLWAMNVANVKGLEAERLNPAGLGYTKKIEVIAAYTSWMTGSGVSLIQGGYAQRIKNHTLALSINSVALKPIEVTTTESPSGGLGLFRPSMINVGLSYAHNFNLGTSEKMGANILTGGATLRLVSEFAQNISATGFCVDLGVMYTTGKKENVHFGVSLRNLGTPMTFKGDALTITSSDNVHNQAYALSSSKQVQQFQLPIQLNIGFAYDVFMGAKKELGEGKFTQAFRLTPMAQFESNAFGNDNYGLGMEFAYNEIFMLRAAYKFQNGIFKNDTRVTAYNGFSAGMSVEVPFKKDRSGPSLGIDYAYRMTAQNTSFRGSHTVGLRVNLGGPDKPKELKESASKNDSKFEETTTSSSTTTTKKGKKSKVTVEEYEATQAKLAELEKTNQELKVKAETPIVKIDTVVRVEEKVVVQRDTVIINSSSVVKTEVVKQDGQTIVKFTDTRPINFESGSSKLTTSSNTYLNEVANMMKANPTAILDLKGYTDNKGDANANVKLSQDRVNAVKSYLVSKGANANNITALGLGSVNPIASNDTEAGRLANRRVELQMKY